MISLLQSAEWENVNVLENAPFWKKGGLTDPNDEKERAR
jgi:hypothetical protein